MGLPPNHPFCFGCPRGSEATDSWRNGGFHPFQTGDIFQPIGSSNLGYNEYVCLYYIYIYILYIYIYYIYIYIYICACACACACGCACGCGCGCGCVCVWSMKFRSNVSWEWVFQPLGSSFLQHPGQRNPMSPTQAMAEICLLALCGGLWHLWGLAGGRWIPILQWVHHHGFYFKKLWSFDLNFGFEFMCHANN